MESLGLSTRENIKEIKEILIAKQTGNIVNTFNEQQPVICADSNVI